ncbi:MAG: diguanylate cyclase [Leptolyngbya sp. SIO1E4]|nr:diguanylate cyclase [Leptolyngbya sp. SIO1E4]
MMAADVRQLLDCDRTLLYQFEPDWSGKVVIESVADLQWSLLNHVVHDSWFKSNRVDHYREGWFAAIEDIATADLTPCHAEFLARVKVKANLVVPILSGETLWGLLIAHCGQPRQWQPEEVEGLQRISVQMGIAVQQAALSEELQATKADLASLTAQLEQAHVNLLEEGKKRRAEVSQQQDILRRSTHQFYQFAAIVESSRDAIISNTLDGTIISWNHAANHLLGYSAQEAIGTHISTLIPPEQRANANQVLQCIYQGQLIDTYETQRLSKVGKRVDVAVTLSPLRDSNGQIMGASTIARDISDRKQAEETLRQSEATNRALIEAMPDFLVRMHQDGVQKEVINKGAIHNFYSEKIADQIKGISIAEMMPADIAQERIQLAKLALDTGEVQRQEYQFLVQGKIHYEEARIVPLLDHDVLVMVRDITRQKQAETDLKATKEQLELFIQATSEGFWDWNLITGDIYFSPRFKEILGYANHELGNTFKIWESLILEDDRATTLKRIEDYNRGKVDHFSITQRFRHKNGSTVHVFCRAIHLKNEQGTVVRMVGSHLDITPMVTIQAALKDSDMQLSSILDSSLDGIMAFRSVRDEVGTIVDFEWLLSNPTACELVGRSAQHLIGHHLLQELPGNRVEGLFDLYVQVVESGEPMQHQVYYTHDAIDSWFEIFAVKLEDGFAVTFRNIDAIKQSEQALQRANQQLEERIGALKQRNTEMLLLSETSDFLQACLTIEEACAVMTSLVEPLFPGCSGGIFITNASRNRIENVASWGTHLHSQTDFYPHDCWALRRGRPHWAGQDRLGLRCNHISAQAEISDTLCIPMIAQGETLGLFYLNGATAGALSAAKQQLARTVAEQVALAIANLNLRETLQHQSIRDPLTGLFNRRYLEESLQQEISRAQRHRHTIGIIMIDLDHFKYFNDTHGHDAGDHVLQAVGKLLREKVRESDIACRYGGEEIVLVLPESSLAENQAKAEVLRDAISKLKVHHNGKTLDALTASFGVACFPEHGVAGSTLVQAADAALYQAKAAGRNQVIVAQ